MIHSKKIIVVGTSCAGKTSFAKKFSLYSSITHFDLDDLHWLPNWVEREDKYFLQDVSQNILTLQSWLVSGNYLSLTKDSLWKEADTIIWLNYNLPTVLWRYIKRSYKRVILKEPCCNGNYETFRHAFFSSESMLLWILKTYNKRKEMFKILQNGTFAHKNWIEFNYPKEANSFIKNLSDAANEH